MCCMVGRVPTNARDMEEELHTNNITQKDCFHQLISISNEVCIVQIVQRHNQLTAYLTLPNQLIVLIQPYRPRTVSYLNYEHFIHNRHDQMFLSPCPLSVVSIFQRSINVLYPQYRVILHSVIYLLIISLSVFYVTILYIQTRYTNHISIHIIMYLFEKDYYKGGQQVGGVAGTMYLFIVAWELVS